MLQGDGNLLLDGQGHKRQARRRQSGQPGRAPSRELGPEQLSQVIAGITASLSASVPHAAGALPADSEGISRIADSLLAWARVEATMGLCVAGSTADGAKKRGQRTDDSQSISWLRRLADRAGTTRGMAGIHREGAVLSGYGGVTQSREGPIDVPDVAGFDADVGYLLSDPPV